MSTITVASNQRDHPLTIQEVMSILKSMGTGQLFTRHERPYRLLLYLVESHFLGSIKAGKAKVIRQFYRDKIDAPQGIKYQQPQQWNVSREREALRTLEDILIIFNSDPGCPITIELLSKPFFDLRIIRKLNSAILAQTAASAGQNDNPLHISDAYSTSSGRVSIRHLPNTDLVELVGRERYLAQLDESWRDPAIHIVTFVARGGLGKTSLIKHWLQTMIQPTGGPRVYGYSFYRQNISQPIDSADEFMELALRWFGDQDPRKGTPQEKGVRLADLIRKEATVLVLDGLEPLQFPPLSLKQGELKDEALRALLLELVAYSNGLCILSTRIRVTELRDFEQTTARLVELMPLSPADGARVLTLFGVHGEQQDLEAAAIEVGGDCLALTLLGTYLAMVWRGDVGERRRVRFSVQDNRLRGHARRVMAAYEEWFAGQPQMSQLLRVIGLFDRPADIRAVAAVMDGPPLVGLTESLNLSDEDFQSLLWTLREAKLIYEPNAPDDTIDTHPMVREFFGALIEEKHPAAWREGHGRLYEFLKQDAAEFPETIEEIAPLYAAVAHACKAGRHQEALNDVYWARILRGTAFFSTNTLGAMGADLALLAGFFETPGRWTKPIATLTDADQAFVLGQAAYTLWTFGQLSDMVPPQQAALAASISQEDWVNASASALNLCDYYITTAQVSRALEYASQSVALAGRIEITTVQDSSATKRYAQQCRDLSRINPDRILAVLMVASRGDVLHCMGRNREARADFEEAERLQQLREPDFPILYSLPGYWYSDFLLRQGECGNVESRAKRTLEWLLNDGEDLLGLGLTYLTIGQAAYLSSSTREGRLIAVEPIDRAVKLLEQRGHRDYLPYALFARAELNRSLQNFAGARSDIDAALTIAHNGRMIAYQIECLVCEARFHRDIGEMAIARKKLEAAKKLMVKTGYCRRTPVPKNEEFRELF